MRMKMTTTRIDGEEKLSLIHCLKIPGIIQPSGQGDLKFSLDAQEVFDIGQKDVVRR